MIRPVLDASGLASQTLVAALVAAMGIRREWRGRPASRISNLLITLAPLSGFDPAIRSSNPATPAKLIVYFQKIYGTPCPSW